MFISEVIIVIIPYRNLHYKAYKFAMVLSSLDIHGLNVSRTALVFFGQDSAVSIALC